MTTRRMLLAGAGAVAVLAALRWSGGDDEVAAGPFEVQKTDDEWRRQLTAAQFNVLRRHATEQPYSSPLNHEKRSGTFVCAGCDLPLFSADTKYESYSGWPSFFRPLANAIGTSQDHAYLWHAPKCTAAAAAAISATCSPTARRRPACAIA